MRGSLDGGLGQQLLPALHIPLCRGNNLFHDIHPEKGQMRVNGIVTFDSYESLLIDSRCDGEHMHTIPSSETLSITLK